MTCAKGWGWPTMPCVFLYVGRLEMVKGIAVLLQAFSNLTAIRDDVCLLIVGDGTLGDMVQRRKSTCPE